MKYDKQSYRQILECAVNQGYEFVDFLSVDLGGKQKQVILRHDIDYSPTMACEMAEIDASCKIKSTFALLLSSPLYNPFTSANIMVINEIHQLGHKIALHHRVTSGRTAEEIRQDIAREMQVMRAFFPYIQPVFIWHNLPSNNLLSDIEVPGVINGYSASFVGSMHYISDSVLRHRPDNFLTALDKHKFLHMLLHPVIWMSQKDNMVSMISCALNKIICECDKEFMLNGAWKEKFPAGIPQQVLETLQELLGGS